MTQTLEFPDDSNDVVYQSFKYPAILTNRDALYNRFKCYDPSNGSYTIVWRSCCHPDNPMEKNFIRTWTIGAYVIEPCPDDPGSSMLYSFGQIDPYGWLPDWFVTQFSPAALKDLIAKVSKCCITEQNMRYGDAGVPEGLIAQLTMEQISGKTDETQIYSEEKVDNFAGDTRDSVTRAASTGSLTPSVDGGKVKKKKKKKKMYQRVFSYFKKLQKKKVKKELGEARVKEKEGTKKSEKSTKLVAKKVKSFGSPKSSRKSSGGGRVDGFSSW